MLKIYDGNIIPSVVTGSCSGLGYFYFIFSLFLPHFAGAGGKVGRISCRLPESRYSQRNKSVE